MIPRDFEESKLPVPVYSATETKASPSKPKWTEGEKLPSLPVCGICFAEMGSQFFPVEGCDHVFDVECIRMHVQVAIQEGQFPIKCATADCEQQMATNDVLMLLTADQERDFYKFSLNKYIQTHPKEVSVCPTPGCEFIVFHTAEEQKFHLCCPMCGKESCLKCGNAWHQGMNCKEAEIENTVGVNDIKFQKYLKQKPFKRCPHCGIWGCCYIDCKCGKNFCYYCLGDHPEHYCAVEEFDKQQAKLREEQRLNAPSPKRVIKRVAPRPGGPPRPGGAAKQGGAARPGGAARAAPGGAVRPAAGGARQGTAGKPATGGGGQRQKPGGAKPKKN